MHLTRWHAAPFCAQKGHKNRDFGPRTCVPRGGAKTGTQVCGADVQLPGLLHGRVLRSPIPHGRIRRIDASKALALPGVEAVVTSEDLRNPGDRIAELGEGAVNLKHLSSNCLARGKVHYKGQAVAAVAAVSPHLAEEALKRIVVDYQPLPHVTDVRAAMRDD